MRDNCLLAIVLIVCLMVASTLYSTPAAAVVNDLSNIRVARPHAGYKEGELLVKFRPGIKRMAMTSLHDKLNMKKVKDFTSFGISHVKFEKNMSMEEALAGYMADPSVEYAEPNHLLKAQELPNDGLFSALWGLHNTGQTGGIPGADIDAVRAWDITTGNKGLVVAVIDTGVDYNHEDISANMWVNETELYGLPGVDNDANGYKGDVYGINTSDNNSDPRDNNGHGTHVAGIIGALGNNTSGVTGVNWNIRIMACKFLDENGSGYTDGAVGCLEYLETMKEKGVNIVAANLSWGGADYSQALYDAIHSLRSVLFIAAAGNSSSDNDRGPMYPAGYDLPNIISVAATDSADSLAAFSNYGRRSVHVGAPGVNIVSLRAGDTDIYGDGSHFVAGPGESEAKYYLASGTSMAAPHVSGLAALIASQNPQRNWKEIRNLILSGGDGTPSMNGKTITGRRINAFGSLSCVNSPVFSALEYPYSITAGTSVTLSALSINCASAIGPVTVTASDGEVITLHDDGVFPDLEAGDGIFTASWTPANESYLLDFSSPAGSETVPIPLVIATDYLSAGLAGKPYRQVLQAKGGLKPYTWSVASGVLPSGLTLNSATGEISGAPVAAGSFTFSVESRDAESVPDRDAKTFSISVYWLPDLAVTSISYPQNSATGTQINVSATVKNKGLGNAGLTRVDFYLSTDPVISKDDIFIGYVELSALSAGAEQTVNITGNLPPNLAGVYYLGAIADRYDWVTESDETNNSLSGGAIAIGKLPPTGSITINNGADFTRSAAVTLTLSISNGDGSANKMCISNTTTCSSWQAYASISRWTLAYGDGKKTVNVWFKDSQGSVSTAAYSDTIVLDTTAPMNGTLSVVPGNGQMTLKWSGFKDSVSGISGYKLVFSTTWAPTSCAAGKLLQTFDGSTASYVHTGLANGTTYYYRVCAIDKAGNMSSGAKAAAKPQ